MCQLPRNLELGSASVQWDYEKIHDGDSFIPELLGVGRRPVASKIIRTIRCTPALTEGAVSRSVIAILQQRYGFPADHYSQKMFVAEPAMA